MSTQVRSRLCICGQPAPIGLAQHPECATEDTIAKRKRTAAAVVPPGVAKEGE